MDCMKSTVQRRRQVSNTLLISLFCRRASGLPPAACASRTIVSRQALGYRATPTATAYACAVRVRCWGLRAGHRVVSNEPGGKPFTTSFWFRATQRARCHVWVARRGQADRVRRRPFQPDPPVRGPCGSVFPPRTLRANAPADCDLAAAGWLRLARSRLYPLSRRTIS